MLLGLVGRPNSGSMFNSKFYKDCNTRGITLSPRYLLWTCRVLCSLSVGGLDV